MKYGRKRIVGFFTGLGLVVMEIPAVSFGVGNNPQWGQDISMVQIWSNGISCSGTRVFPYHVLTAAHCYNGSNGGIVITSNSEMRIWDSNSAKLYHSGGNITSQSLYPDGGDLALIAMKTPLSGVAVSVVLCEPLPDNDMTEREVSLCGQRLVDNSGNSTGGDKYNASCSVAGGRVVLNSTHVNTRWLGDLVPVYYGGSGDDVSLDGNLIGVIPKSAGVTWEEARHNGGLVEVAREQYSPQPLVTHDVYNWLVAHGAQVILVAAPQQPQQPKLQGTQAGKSRIGRVNQVGTSLLLSDKAANGSEVVLTTGRNFPDGLVAGTLAGASKSGIVLTMGTSTIEPGTLNELKSVGTSKVTIIGGTGVASRGVEGSLKAVDIQVERTAGTDRYDTASQVLDYAKASGKLELNARGESHVLVVTDRSFPDALATSAVVARIGAAVVLVDTPEQVDHMMAGTQPYAVEAQIDRLMVDIGVSMSRWFDGEDRYGTTNKLVDWSVWKGGDTVMVTVGTNYPDALAAGRLAAPTGQLLVLVNPSSTALRVPTSMKNLVFIGGEGANPGKCAVVN